MMRQVLEGTFQGNFVPNDTNLDVNGEHCQIVTGPNMGGKSCYIRQVALIALMAQVNQTVPLLFATVIYTQSISSNNKKIFKPKKKKKRQKTTHKCNNMLAR